MPWHIISLFLSHLFWTKCSLPCSLPRRKRRRKRLRVQSWDHWQLDVTKVNWNNRFLCVYVINGPLVSAVLGFLQKGEAGEHCGYRAVLEVWGRHTHTHILTHCNEQVMLRHRLLKSVIIINLSLHLSLSPSSPSPFPLSFFFFPVYISEQAWGNPSLSTGGNEFID